MCVAVRAEDGNSNPRRGDASAAAGKKTETKHLIDSFNHANKKRFMGCVPCRREYKKKKKEKKSVWCAEAGGIIAQHTNAIVPQESTYTTPFCVRVESHDKVVELRFIRRAGLARLPLKHAPVPRHHKNESQVGEVLKAAYITLYIR